MPHPRASLLGQLRAQLPNIIVLGDLSAGVTRERGGVGLHLVQGPLQSHHVVVHTRGWPAISVDALKGGRRGLEGKGVKVGRGGAPSPGR